MHQLSASYDRFRMSAKDLAHGGDRVQERQTRATVVKQVAMERDDESLLIAVGNSQDREAFNVLFHRFGSKIFALGMKITRNEQLANDLVQEAMLIIWQKAPLYDLDKGSAQTWIFTLVRNRCFDILRKLKRQPDGISADDIYAETELELSVDPEQQQAAEIQLEQIQQYFGQLPAPQQQVIEYVFMRDLTHQEAAQQLNIPLGTLKSRLRLALSKLRDFIGVEQ
ncbi:MAG: sigma-70 family RNA polymerase sigma factor [Gammaproteobacteria bacterium]|nr:sigma-70 family RNA polymerase sigma factor [Pseudomonadales bacterium]MCP5346161.1 sigma-70 family RNA polymerase sigma factor [Pseudomonadales bacterium]